MAVPGLSDGGGFACVQVLVLLQKNLDLDSQCSCCETPGSFPPHLATTSARYQIQRRTALSHIWSIKRERFAIDKRTLDSSRAASKKKKHFFKKLQENVHFPIEAVYTI